MPLAMLNIAIVVAINPERKSFVLRSDAGFAALEHSDPVLLAVGDEIRGDLATRGPALLLHMKTGRPLHVAVICDWGNSVTALSAIG